MKRMLPIAAAVLLSACTTTDPYTGEQKTSNTTKGAGIGAVAGAVIGAATSSKKDREKGIVTGALAGAAIGGGVGLYMDKQEEALREKLQGTGVQVRRDGNNLYLVMPGNITFATGQSSIKPTFFGVLDSVAQVLSKFDSTYIDVAGHTDSTGSRERNQELSEQRANSVKAYLLQRGVAKVRIHTTGYGQRYPIASNTTADGRQANRRVELKLEPIEQ